MSSRTNNASRTSNPSQRYIPWREHQKLKNRLDSLSKSANIYKDLIAVLDHSAKAMQLRVPYFKKLEQIVKDNNKEINSNFKNLKMLKEVTKKHIDILYDRVRKLEGKPSMENVRAAETLAGISSSSSTSGSSGTKRRRTGGKKRKSRRKTRRKIHKTKRKKKRSKRKTKKRR